MKYEFGKNPKLDKQLQNLKAHFPTASSVIVKVSSEYDDNYYNVPEGGPVVEILVSDPANPGHIGFLDPSTDKFVATDFPTNPVLIYNRICRQIGELVIAQYCKESNIVMDSDSSFENYVDFKLLISLASVSDVVETPKSNEVESALSFLGLKTETSVLDSEGETCVRELESLKITMQEKARTLLTNAVAVYVRKSSPYTISVPLRGYIPYFNDGDACTFSIYSVDEETEEVVGDKDNKQHQNAVVVTEGALEKLITKRGKHSWDVTYVPEFRNTFNELDRFVREYQTFFQMAFGDYFKVVIFADGTYTHEEWEDYSD